MFFYRFSTLRKFMTLTKDGSPDPDALVAFNAVMGLPDGKKKIKQLFYGVDKEKMVRYNSSEKLAALWIKVDRNIGRLVHEMQWQSIRVGLNGSRRRSKWHAIRK